MNLQLHLLFNRKAVPVRAGPIRALGNTHCFSHRTIVGTDHWTHQASYTTHTECFSPRGERVYLQHTAEIKNTGNYTSSGKFQAPAALPQKYPLNRRLGGHPRVGLAALEKRKTFCACQKSSHDSSVVHTRYATQNSGNFCGNTS
jgi:hypothetical protein